MPADNNKSAIKPLGKKNQPRLLSGVAGLYWLVACFYAICFSTVEHF